MLAALLVLNIAVAAIGPITCDGWQRSPLARKSCCTKAHGGCPDQSASDACCARSEQRQHMTGEQAVAAMVIATPVADAVFAHDDIKVAASSRVAVPLAHGQSTRGRPHDPPFLTSVLLI